MKVESQIFMDEVLDFMGKFNRILMWETKKCTGGILS